MRKFLLAPLALALACTSTAPAGGPSAAPSSQPAVYGLTLAEEGRILGMEDRREYDPQLAAAWIAHPNALHRTRMAMALARIGPHTFVDTNGNGERDANELQAGVALLTPLVSDPDRNVRETAAFALGEIGDPAGIPALLEFARDGDAAVAAEAVEALSKMAPQVKFDRFRGFLAPSEREGVRVRAIQFLFRFDSDEASGAAAALLDSPAPAIRRAATYALSRRAFSPARPKVELLLTDPLVDVRVYAAAALGRIADRESIAPLLAALGDAYPWVRTNALVAIGRIEAKDATAIERPGLARDARQIVGLTDDPDPGTRASSIEVLGWYARKDELAKKRLSDLLTSGSRWDRELAVGAWAKQFGPVAANTSWEKVRAVESRFDAGYFHDPDPMVRAATITNVPGGALAANAAAIRAAVDDPDVVVRATAIDTYSKLPDPDLRMLEAAEQRGRSDRMDDARLSAITALAAIDYPDREHFLRSLLSDADPVVRRVAADLIVEKLKRNRPQYTPLPIKRAPAEYEAIAAWSRTPHSATIRMTRGDIQIALLTQEAPMTTWNFAELARKHYFDGTTFMRVVPNFVVQGGDPRNDMSGGPGYAIRDEINMQKYTRGAVGMALSGPDTGGSQFFITHSAQPHLDGGYTIFGRVVGGLGAVVDQTERGDSVRTIVIDDGK